MQDMYKHGQSPMRPSQQAAKHLQILPQPHADTTTTTAATTTAAPATDKQLVEGNNPVYNPTWISSQGLRRGSAIGPGAQRPPVQTRPL